MISSLIDENLTTAISNLTRGHFAVNNDFPVATDIGAILLQRATITPDKIAFRFLQNGDDDIVEWTYAQLDAYAHHVANALTSRLSVGSKVLLVLEPGLKYIAALFGIFKADMTAVPSFPPSGNRAIARLASIYADCNADLIIADGGLRHSEQRLNTTLASSSVHGRTPEWLFIDDDYFSDKSVYTYKNTDKISINDQYVRTHYRDDIPSTHESFPALLQYTSGSTGEPKGVMLSHANLISNSHVLDTRLGTMNKHTGFSWLPPYHDMGLMGALLLSVYSGFTLVLMSPAHFIQRPLRWLKGISQHRVTTSVAPNFALDLCVDTITEDELTELDLSSLKMLFCGAEPVRQTTLNRFSAKFAACGFSPAAFVPCYGLAEATLFISGKADQQAAPTFLSLDKAALSLGIAQLANGNSDQTTVATSCGTVASNHIMKIVDPDTLLQLPAGVVGEIWFKGPSVAQGYLHQTSSSISVFKALIEEDPCESGSYLRTGDLGFILDDELYVTGRIKDVIIFAGRNLYPQDIEVTVQTHHSVIRTNGVAAFSISSEHTEQLAIVAEVTRTAKMTSTISATCQGYRRYRYQPPWDSSIRGTSSASGNDSVDHQRQGTPQRMP
jgi:acyl-CoA synthetase (AMP-forming)/AMP-acid ligase II